MSVFNVELKKVVDDTYEIEIGYQLSNKLIDDLQKGLVGNIRKFAVITDTNVQDLYAKPICEKLLRAGFSVDMFVFAAGEKSKTRETKAKIEAKRKKDPADEFIPYLTDKPVIYMFNVDEQGLTDKDLQEKLRKLINEIHEKRPFASIATNGELAQRAP